MADSPENDGAGIGPHIWFAVFVGALVAFAVAYLVYAGGAQRRAVRRMPAGERDSTFHRLDANFSALCEPDAPTGLEERCRDDARFMLEFPECDHACRERLIFYVDSPTK